MFANQFQGGLPDLSVYLTTVATNLLVQSTLIIAIGLAAAFLWKRRGAALQSTILRITLLAVLVCPLASWTLQRAGVSGFRVELPVVSQPESTQSPVRVAARGELASSSQAFQAALTIPAQDQEAAASSRDGSSYEVPSVHDRALSLKTDRPLAASGVDGPSFRNKSIAVCAAVSMTWLAISGLLFARVGFAHGIVWLARRTACPADALEVSMCRSAARSLKVGTPQVMVHASIKSPCLVGWLRPVVLLPDGEAVCRDVFVHELAHLRRSDCFWHWLSTLTSAVLWFQPLAWLLARRIEQTADDVCDDYVVAFGSDRQEYAHVLVDLAERLQPAWSAATAGCGIVPFGSSLRQRVLRILDTSRSPSVRTGFRAVLATLSLAVCGTFGVGLLGAAQNEPAEPPLKQLRDQLRNQGSANQSDAVAVANQNVRSAVERQQEPADSSAKTLVNVLGPDNRPLAGATLYAPQLRVPVPRSEKDIGFRALGTTNDRGQADVALTSIGSGFGPPKTLLIAVADRHGLDWIELKNRERPKSLTLKLTADQPIRGRLLNSEGQPLANAKLEVIGLLASSNERVDEFLKSWRRTADLAYDVADRKLFASLNQVVKLKQPDKQGRFEIRGLGEERLASIFVSGPGFTKTRLHVVLRNGFDPKPINAAVAEAWPRQLRPGPPPVLHGPSLVFVPNAARALGGTVREAKSGKPVPNAIVTSNGGVGGQLRAVTNAEGRFRFAAVNKSVPEYFVRVIPGPKSTLLPKLLRVRNPQGLEPIQLDVDLPQGVAITGRVIDRSSGKGVAGARLTFVPLADNKHFGKRPGFDSIGLVDVRTSSDGTFRMVSVPGSVAVLARAVEPANGTSASPFRQAIPSDEDLPRLRMRNNYITTAGGSLAPLYLYNAVTVADVDEVQGVECNLHLDRGGRVEVQIHDADDKPLRDVMVAGTAAISPNIARLNTSRMTIMGLDKNKPRRVLFFHPGRRLAGSIEVRGDENKLLSVHLKPAGKLKGRAVDQEGQPVVGAMLVFRWRDPIAEDLYRALRPMLPPAVTGEDGSFRAEGVLTDVPYTLSFARPRNRIPLDAEKRWDVLKSSSTETDLGDVRVKPQQ